MSGLERLVGGRGAPQTRPERLIGATISEGTVLAIDETGITFTAAGFDGNVAKFGPAPWANPQVTAPTDGLCTPVPPATGDRALIVWVGGFPNNPWIIATWPA